VLNLSDKVKILYLLKVGMSLSEGGQYYGKNESSLHSIEYTEHEIRSVFWCTVLIYTIIIL
jgi:hypothetical protein